MQVRGDCYYKSNGQWNRHKTCIIFKMFEAENDVDHVDLDAFVSKGTNAPQWAVQGLRWFSNAGQLGWCYPPTRLSELDEWLPPYPSMVAHLLLLDINLPGLALCLTFCPTFAEGLDASWQGGRSLREPACAASCARPKY